MLQRDLWVSSKAKATFGVCAKLRFEALSKSFSKKSGREREKKEKESLCLCFVGITGVLNVHVESHVIELLDCK